MHLRSMNVRNYRSLRSIRMDIAQTSLFVGENGAGKSNLYRALQLLKAASEDRFAQAIAEEGGLASVLWTGERRKHETPRIVLEAEWLDEERAVSYFYRIEAGKKTPTGAGFNFEPQIKEEELKVDTGRRPVSMMMRKGGAVSARNEDGRMIEWPQVLAPSETALAILGDSGRFPELGDLRRSLNGWRFFHGFRSDAQSPIRFPGLAVTAPMLEEDGSNLAAVFATLAHIRQDTVDLDRAVFDAFPGAALSIPEPNENVEFGLVLPEFPKRVFAARELSDGQIRFLALAGALLSYRLPEFIALNEPESSLHPDMLPPLARMIAHASRDAQVWVVTHSDLLSNLIAQETGATARTVVRDQGSTWIEGMRLTGAFAEDED